MTHLIRLLILSALMANGESSDGKPKTSVISGSYILDYESLAGSDRPRFSPGSAAPDPPEPDFSKRSQSTTFINNSTASFIIYLTCQSVAEFQCNQALHHISRAATRIERVIHLPEKVYINASFYPFCNSQGICDNKSVLGQAAPSIWHLFQKGGSNESSLPRGADSDYAYPSSLVRQWLPNDPAIRNSYPDIGASFNSEVNWWFSSSNGPDSKGLPQDGQFGATTSNLNSTLKSYDFEQVAMHELFHGMGMISSWYNWNEFFLPSFPIYSGSNLTGLSLSFIYDRYLSDALNGYWIKDYGTVIRRDFKKAVDQAHSLGQAYQWKTFFTSTEGANISRALKQSGSPFLTIRGLWSWYPVYRDERIIQHYVVLYTPPTYDEGSTGSHVDDKFYVGTSQYLMRPYAAKQVGLDGYIPANPRGPIAETTLGLLRAMGYTTRQ